VDRTARFLLSAAGEFALSFLFFANLPWMNAVTGWNKWFLAATRAGEIFTVYLCAYGLHTWAAKDPIRWDRIRRGISLMGVILLLHALYAYSNMLVQLDSPLIQDYLVQWQSIPHLCRIAIAVLVILIGTFTTRERLQPMVITAVTLALVIYRLAPELHILLYPIDDACC